MTTLLWRSLLACLLALSLTVSASAVTREQVNTDSPQTINFFITHNVTDKVMALDTVGAASRIQATVDGTTKWVADASGFRVGGTTAPFLSSGTGTPEGTVTAPPGSLRLRTDGGAGTGFYVKESGTGNTGWVAK